MNPKMNLGTNGYSRNAQSTANYNSITGDNQSQNGTQDGKRPKTSVSK